MPIASLPATGARLAAVAALFLTAAAPCQQTTSTRSFPANPGLLQGFDVEAATVQSLSTSSAANGETLVPVRLGGQQFTMALHLHDVRGPGFQLLVADATGLHPQPRPACVTYRGHLVEEPQSAVVATIVDGSVEAMVYRHTGNPNLPIDQWVVQPVRQVDASARPSLHVVYHVADCSPLPFTCGNTQTATTTTPAVGGTDFTQICDIAIEGDVQFYQQNNSSVTNAQNDITSVMNQVDFVYDRDCDIQYNVTTIIISTTGVYGTNGAGSLLSQFQTRWNTVHAGVQRDVAHLFTGRNLSGSTIGIAQLSTVCTLTAAYGLSESRFTPNFNRRVGLTCHELGHNFSALHCDGVNPCNIMCSGLGGCSNNVTAFSPTGINNVTSFAYNLPCLTVIPTGPTISSTNASTVPIFYPGTLQLSGSGFYGVNSFEVGGQTYYDGINVLSDTTMNLILPDGMGLGQTTLSVTNFVGTSNQVALTYAITSPPRLRQTASIPPTGGALEIGFGGTPDRLWFLVLGITNQQTPIQGVYLLSNPLLLANGVFTPPNGIETMTVPVPGGLGYLQFYTQVLEADPTTAMATASSNFHVLILQ